MYEGKHIHYSPLDNKPLCSYSTKVCKQRRLNGYAFCIRHILEDKDAPFKQCAYVAKYNNKKCTNPIPENEDRGFCNSHMQVAGMVPRKERKIKSTAVNSAKVAGPSTSSVVTSHIANSSVRSVESAVDPYAFEDVDPVGKLSSDYRVLKSKVATKFTAPVGSLGIPNGPKVGQSELRDVLRGLPNSKAGKTGVTQERTDSVWNQVTVNGKTSESGDSSSESFGDGDAQQAGSDSSNCSGSSSSSSSSESSDTEESDGTELSSLGGSSPASSSSFKRHPPDTLNRLSGGKVSRQTAIAVQPSAHTQTPDVWHRQPKVRQSNNYLSSGNSALSRLKQLHEARRRWQGHLFPLGMESSDTDETDSDLEDLPSRLFQREWFVPNKTVGTADSRRELLTNRKIQLDRQIRQMTTALKLQNKGKQDRKKWKLALYQAAKSYPNRTAAILSDGIGRNGVKITKRSRTLQQPICGLHKCRYKEGEADACTDYALPYTWHCVRHIMYNVDQQLFEHCTAKFANNTQCCVPVFDICHELPLCAEHARKRDNYDKMCAESKPKKARKKTKPSALTRPTKRGKKKRKLTTLPYLTGDLPDGGDEVPVTLQSVSDHLHVDHCTNVQGSALAASHICSSITEDNEDDEAEMSDPLSPETINKGLELSIDTAELADQASQLLEEHDLSDVLSKISDETFNELFTGTKNGVYEPTREESDDLRCAFETAEKDAKLHDMELQETILNANLDENTLNQIAQGSIPIDNLNLAAIGSELSFSDPVSGDETVTTSTFVATQETFHVGIDAAGLQLATELIPSHLTDGQLIANGLTLTAGSSAGGRAWPANGYISNPSEVGKNVVADLKHIVLPTHSGQIAYELGTVGHMHTEPL